MKSKFGTTFFLMLFASFCFAQSSYSIDCPKPDSCFLKEVTVSATDEANPRPQTVTSYRLFRSQHELDGILSAIRKQADEAFEKSMELLNTSNELRKVANKIEAIRPKK